MVLCPSFLSSCLWNGLQCNLVDETETYSIDDLLKIVRIFSAEFQRDFLRKKYVTNHVFPAFMQSHSTTRFGSMSVVKGIRRLVHETTGHKDNLCCFRRFFGRKQFLLSHNFALPRPSEFLFYNLKSLELHSLTNCLEKTYPFFGLSYVVNVFSRSSKVFSHSRNFAQVSCLLQIFEILTKLVFETRILLNRW